MSSSARYVYIKFSVNILFVLKQNFNEQLIKHFVNYNKLSTFIEICDVDIMLFYLKQMQFN